MSKNVVKTLYSEDYDLYEEPMRIHVDVKLFTGQAFSDAHYIVHEYVEEKQTENAIVDAHHYLPYFNTTEAQAIRQSIAIFDRLFEEYGDTNSMPEDHVAQLLSNSMAEPA